MRTSHTHNTRDQYANRSAQSQNAPTPGDFNTERPKKNQRFRFFGRMFGGNAGNTHRPANAGNARRSQSSGAAHSPVYKFAYESEISNGSTQAKARKYASYYQKEVYKGNSHKYSAAYARMRVDGWPDMLKGADYPFYADPDTFRTFAKKYAESVDAGKEPPFACGYAYIKCLDQYQEPPHRPYCDTFCIPFANKFQETFNISDSFLFAEKIEMRKSPEYANACLEFRKIWPNSSSLKVDTYATAIDSGCSKEYATAYADGYDYAMSRFSHFIDISSHSEWKPKVEKYSEIYANKILDGHSVAYASTCAAEFADKLGSETQSVYERLIKQGKSELYASVYTQQVSSGKGEQYADLYAQHFANGGKTWRYADTYAKAIVDEGFSHEDALRLISAKEEISSIILRRNISESYRRLQRESISEKKTRTYLGDKVIVK